MMFKRKKEKELSVGDRCILNVRTRSALSEEPSYLSSSIIKFCDNLNYRQLTPRILRSNRKLKIMLADCEMLYINKNSIFDGLVEVIPLTVRKDNQYAIGLRNFIQKQEPFLVNKDSLKRVSLTDIQESNSSFYNFRSINFVSEEIRRKYNKSFSWVCS